MCFTIDQNHKEVKIAEEDIICYKMFNDPKFYNVQDSGNNFMSCFINFLYKKGKRYDLDKIIQIVNSDQYPYHYINEGFHSYVESAKVSFMESAKVSFMESEILRRTLKYLNSWGDTIQVKCIIPKGTRYYLNENFDSSTSTSGLATYVSESIIIGTDKDIIE